jgi:predicted Fe-Mo cluster-binding NifX family protein
MKIAIASLEKNETSQISDRAGRAPYYLIFDENGELLEVIDNPFSFGGGGAGFSVAKMLADKGIDIIVAGKFGDKMIGAIEERGLKYFEITGTAKEALNKIEK